jgi:RsiW-degrading membrane proteinase PrsW (M82 family)
MGQTRCLFCGQQLDASDAVRQYCRRCGKELPDDAAFCPRCGARMERSAAAVQPPLPSAPQGLAQVGYLLLIAVGGLLIAGGIGYGAFTSFTESTVVDSALSIAIVAIGALLAWGGRRAFQVARWQSPSLLPEWAWLGLMALPWGLGSLVTMFLPRAARWALPPLIVLAAALASLLFLSATLHGLKWPAGRSPLSGELVPRHVLSLSAATSAAFSTALSLFFEGIALAVVFLVLLAWARFSGDAATVDRLLSAADDPAVLDRLEEMIVTMPLVAIGLGSLLVISAPAIEEVLKGLPLLVFACQRSRLAERAAILLGVAGGVGFAFAENVGYLSMLADDWWLLFWFRTGAAVMHGAASGFIGRAWYRGVGQRRWAAALLDLGKGWGIHALWNVLALLVGWFSYKGVQEGVLFCIGVGLVPLAILFTIMARWGIWVSEK